MQTWIGKAPDVSLGYLYNTTCRRLQAAHTLVHTLHSRSYRLVVEILASRVGQNAWTTLPLHPGEKKETTILACCAGPKCQCKQTGGP